MTHILHTRTVHKTASLADEGNSAYCQSSGTHKVYPDRAENIYCFYFTVVKKCMHRRKKSMHGARPIESSH